MLSYADSGGTPVAENIMNGAGRQCADLVSFGLLGEAPFCRGDAAGAAIRSPSAHVLINGETGTGKELVARAVHYPGRGATSHSCPSIAERCPTT